MSSSQWYWRLLSSLFGLIAAVLLTRSNLNDQYSEISATSPEQVEKGLRPNIILILVDDMGYSDLSCLGSEIATPNIDKLASGGLLMTQFYNAARCCPTRASLLTGLYPHQAGMGHQNKDFGIPSYSGRINNNAVTIAQVLKSAGYRTYQVGKWHVGNTEAYWPAAKGFDQYLTLIDGAMSYFNLDGWTRGQQSMKMLLNGEDYSADDDFFATDTFTNKAVEFITEHDEEQPYFMYLAYNAPHWPLHIRPEDRELYRGHYDPGWDKTRELRLKRMRELGVIDSSASLTPRFGEIPAWDSLSETEKSEWAEKMELYAAVMHRLDLGIGRVIQALDRENQIENTLILFLTDNGACHEDPIGPWITYPLDGEPGGAESFPAYELPWANVSNTPYSWFKSYLHEGGIRTPLIAHYPAAIPAGSTDYTTKGHIIDIMPTLLELAFADYPECHDGNRITPMEGASLVPAFLGKQHTINQRVLFWEHEFNRAVRDGNWKLVSAWKTPEGKPINRWELYDLLKDPTELNDLSSQFPERVKRMAKKYASWAEKVGAYEKGKLQELRKSNP